MEARPIIEQLKATEDRLRRKIEEMEAPLAQAKEDLRNIAGTIAFYERSSSGPAAPVKVPITATTTGTAVTADAFGADNLRGLTQKQAVVSIARHNGGIVRAQEAKRLMIQAGIMRPTKNATRMVHNAIITSERFERIAPGEFRLKTPAQLGSVATASTGLFSNKPPVQ